MTHVPYPFSENTLSRDEKIQAIERHFSAILSTLGMNLEDDSLKNTPRRYAKMLVEELCSGLDPDSFPTLTTQENKFQYRYPLIQSRITLHSLCEHHFVPIIGWCHVGYVPHSHVLGLSKLNRIVEYYSRRPQVQERLTRQVREALCTLLNTEDVAVVVDALHLCVRMRGIQDQDAITRTIDLGGTFERGEMRREFFESIPSLHELEI